jgi:hypothetical protein
MGVEANRNSIIGLNGPMGFPFLEGPNALIIRQGMAK